MSEVQEIVARIQKSAAQLDASAQGSDAAKKATLELRLASFELNIASTPPQDWIHSEQYLASHLAAIHALNSHGVLRSIPDSGEISYADLAQNVGLGQDVLERLCRFLATLGFLCESHHGYVAHTPTSRMTRDHAIGLSFCPEVFVPGAWRLTEALANHPEASEPTLSACALAFPRADGKPTEGWDLMSENPVVREQFTKLMQFGVLSSQSGVDLVQSGFDWASLPPGSKIVDVGGGKGHVMLALAETYPHLEYIVQDRAVLMTGELLDSQIKFMEHDFFTPQKLEAEVYFFRKIFHDWSDPYCRKILESLKPALKTGTKLIINEFVLPEPKGHPDHAEYIARRNDMVMLIMANGKERSLEQWKALVTGFDTRWHFQKVEMKEGTVSGMLIFEYS